MAGQLTIAMANSGVQNGSKTVTVQDADWQTLIDYYKAKLAIQGTPNATNTQALNQWFADIASAAAAVVKKMRTDAAVAAAAAGVADVIIS